MEIVLSLVSAMLFALGTVLQQRAGTSESSAGARSGLVLRMAQRPVWLAGTAADGLGFVAQAAALAGTGAGLLFALSAALTKAVVDQLSTGLLHVIGSWELYALIGIGYTSMTLNQLALNTGALAAAAATSFAADPVASVVLGVVLFHESLHLSGLRALGALTAFALALLGTAVLASQEQAASAHDTG